jgi:hypothetical protein
LGPFHWWAERGLDIDHHIGGQRAHGGGDRGEQLRNKHQIAMGGGKM